MVLSQNSLEGLHPSQVLVLLVDFQNQFCHPDACKGGVITNRNNAAAAIGANAFATEAAALGADERGYRIVVPQDLVSGLDDGDASYNRAVRDYLRST